MIQKENPPCLAIVIPCYNEQSILRNTLDKLYVILSDCIKNGSVASNSFIYCVDDGSTDQTWSIIKAAYQNNSSIKGLKLSRNEGHQKALLAGLMQIKEKVDCVISIDADLQDDINTIATMISHYRNGSDIVYGIRESRLTDTFFKKNTAILFYKLMRKSGAELIFNHADFRLLSYRALQVLSQFQERNIFLRGIIPLIGYPNTKVYYSRKERLSGESKYTIKKMLGLAWDGITSFSNIPLRFILIIGAAVFIFSLIMMTWVLLSKFFLYTTPGWASIMIPLFFMGGIQLLSIGILGEYMAKVFLEVKHRPRYIKDSEIF